MHILLAGHGCVTSKGSRVSSFGSHRVLFLVEKGASLDRTLFNVILQRILSKKTEAEVEAEINELIALPSSTLVSAQHIPTQMNHHLPAAAEVLTHQERQDLKVELEKLDLESSESRLSWELLEHVITPALEEFQHDRILKIDTFGYERRDMIHREYLLGNRFTLDVGIDFSKILRDVTAMHSSSLNHGDLNNDHILFIRLTAGSETHHKVSFTFLMEILTKPRIFVFCQQNRKRQADEATQVDCSSALDADASANPSNSLKIMQVVPLFRQPDQSDENFLGAGDFLLQYSAIHAGYTTVMHNCSFVLPDPQQGFLICKAPALFLIVDDTHQMNWRLRLIGGPYGNEHTLCKLCILCMAAAPKRPRLDSTRLTHGPPSHQPTRGRTYCQCNVPKFAHV
jgi:methyl coenzyme M reductase subunit D